MLDARVRLGLTAHHILQTARDDDVADVHSLKGCAHGVVRSLLISCSSASSCARRRWICQIRLVDDHAQGIWAAQAMAAR